MPDIIIEHKDGRQYALTSASDFEKDGLVANAKGEMVSYKAAGFKVVSSAGEYVENPPSDPDAPRGFPMAAANVRPSQTVEGKAAAAAKADAKADAEA